MSYRCVLHGSFRKHLKLIEDASQKFQASRIEVLAPTVFTVQNNKDGFVIFEGEDALDPRQIELEYLHKLKKLGKTGFSYFLNPEGIIGTSASYELGIAQTLNVPCFFLEPPKDHPVYVPKHQIMDPDQLGQYLQTHNKLPEPEIPIEETKIHQLWMDLIVPSSVIAVGAIIQHQSSQEILLVKTHKWGDRYSIIGGKVRRNERLRDALLREVKEESGLTGEVGKHLCTFDQIKNSGYYQSWINHVYVDNIVTVDCKNVVLNEEAEEYLWAPAEEALAHLDIEPNARHTLELFVHS